jgi:hypothetical protein
VCRRVSCRQLELHGWRNGWRPAAIATFGHLPPLGGSCVAEREAASDSRRRCRSPTRASTSCDHLEPHRDLAHRTTTHSACVTLARIGQAARRQHTVCRRVSRSINRAAWVAKRLAAGGDRHFDGSHGARSRYAIVANRRTLAGRSSARRDGPSHPRAARARRKLSLSAGAREHGLGRDRGGEADARVGITSHGVRMDRDHRRPWHRQGQHGLGRRPGLAPQERLSRKGRVPRRSIGGGAAAATELARRGAGPSGSRGRGFVTVTKPKIECTASERRFIADEDTAQGWMETTHTLCA